MGSGTGGAKLSFRMGAGGVVGNILEWYDFAVFGYFAALIGHQFFPSEDKYASLIKVFGVFAAGYLVRPLGGLVFGRIGDRTGRKRALQLSVALMAAPTVMLGLLPTHAQIGILAPVLLVSLRLLQGLSVGGELIGSISYIIEISPPERRGFFGSFTLFSAVTGVLLGSAAAALLHALLSAQALAAWGWRIPFLAGIGIGGFGLWMRSGLAESPEFERLRSAGEISESPMMTALRAHPAKILQVAGLVAAMGGGFYMLFVWWPTYLTHIIATPTPHALTVNTICMAVFTCLIPAAGWLSDRTSRKTVLAIGAGGLILAAFPLFAWVDHGTVAGALAAGLLFSVLVAMLQGPMPATMTELFPAQTRNSAVGLGYNLTMALVCGTAPLLSTWLIQATGTPVAPAFYLMFLSLITLTAAGLLPRAGLQTRARGSGIAAAASHAEDAS